MPDRPDSGAWWERVEELLARALELPDGERSAYVDARTHRDATLRLEVLSLLASYREDFLETRLALAELAAAACCTRTFPERVGAYRILGFLGEGAHGVVLHAVQERPNRHVALKLLKPGTGGAERLRRFEREIECLGRLEHPGIARIYETGFHDSEWGRLPFFAMELVRGTTLVEHASDAGLDVPARVELLAHVCDAVEAAHRTGVIHRDLKPRNILVDRDGRPRVLDFGIARLVTTGDEAGDGANAATATGQVLGTLPYASPEQIAGPASAVDKRTDVFALGVIGYELLAGRRPWSIDGEPLGEVLRILREVRPQPLGQLDTTLGGDLELLIETALAPQPEARHPSVAELADDLRRWLRHEPVRGSSNSQAAARDPSQPRRASAVALVALVMLALAGAVAMFAGRRGESPARSRTTTVVGQHARDAENAPTTTATTSAQESEKPTTGSASIANGSETADPVIAKLWRLGVEVTFGDDGIAVRVPPDRFEPDPLFECLARVDRLSSLDLAKCRLDDPGRLATLAHLEHLTAINLDGTDITDVSVLAQLQRLEAVDVSVNYRLDDIGPLAQLPRLRSLRVISTSVDDLAPLQDLKRFELLYASDSRVANLAPLAGVSTLLSLELDAQPVSDLRPLAGLVRLRRLLLHRAKIDDLSALRDLVDLRVLGVGYTAVSDLSPLAGLTRLESIDLDGTRVADIAPLAGMRGLTTLLLTGTRIETLDPLADLEAIETLNIGRTKVRDLGVLAGLTALRRLWVDDLEVDDLRPLLSLRSLEFLTVAGTREPDPGVLEALGFVARLDVTGTPASEATRRRDDGDGVLAFRSSLQSRSESVARPRFIVVANTATSAPGGDASFTSLAANSLDGPAIAGGVVVFRGETADGGRGIYRFEHGELACVLESPRADRRATTAPGAWTQFESGPTVTADGRTIVFVARAAVGRAAILRHRDGWLETLLETRTDGDGADERFADLIGPPVASGDRVAFVAEDARGERAIWSLDASGVVCVASADTRAPGFQDDLRFSLFDGRNLALDGETLVFRSAGGERRGIWSARVAGALAPTVTPVALAGTYLPQANGRLIEPFVPTVDAESIAFGFSGASPERVGIAILDSSGLRVVGDTAPLAARAENAPRLLDFGPHVGLSGDRLAFVASADPSSSARALYIVDRRAGAPECLLEPGDLLHGRTIETMMLGPRQPLDADRLAFLARFADRSEGIYIADFRSTRLDEPSGQPGTAIAKDDRAGEPTGF